METVAHPRYHLIAHRDFDRALRRTFWTRIGLKTGGQALFLQSFNEIWNGQGTPIDRGINEVEIDAIVGSSGRYRDFDPQFLPVRRENDDRWVNVAQAHYEGIELPPVNLYKFGDTYFVNDGNHRVSVARIIGLSSIKARVVEICA